MIVVAAQPNDWNSDSEIGLGGTRILKPCRSSGVMIGLVEVVIWRKPSSRIRRIGCRPDFSMSAHTRSPTRPSSAFHACSGDLKAKPMLSIAAAGTSEAKMLSPTPIVWMAPERRLDIMWVSSPNWLLGNTCTSISPLVASLIFLPAATQLSVIG